MNHQCGSEYSNFNQSKIHVQIHFSGKNLKSCVFCGRGFSRQSELRVHLGTDHSTEKLYTYLEQSLCSIFKFSHEAETDS